MMLLIVGGLILLVTGLRVPTRQRDRHAVTAACFIYSALMQVTVLLAHVREIRGLSFMLLLALLAGGIATTLRAAYQSPRRRIDDYRKYYILQEDVRRRH